MNACEPVKSDLRLISLFLVLPRGSFLARLLASTVRAILLATNEREKPLRENARWMRKGEGEGEGETETEIETETKTRRTRCRDGRECTLDVINARSPVIRCIHGRS